MIRWLHTKPQTLAWAVEASIELATPRPRQRLALLWYVCGFMNDEFIHIHTYYYIYRQDAYHLILSILVWWLHECLSTLFIVRFRGKCVMNYESHVNRDVPIVSSSCGSSTLIALAQRSQFAYISNLMIMIFLRPAVEIWWNKTHTKTQVKQIHS